MISHQSRLIFVHIPKTAGSSVKKALGEGWQDHKDLLRYRKELDPEIFDSYFKFTVVRNPWERLLSDYNYQCRLTGHRSSKLHLFDERGRRRKFRDWLRIVLEDPFRYEAREWGGTVSKGIHRWSPQYDWISIDGKLGVDFVARLETLSEDMAYICKVLDLPSSNLPRCRRRFHWHYSHYYDATTRDLVATHWRRDIEAFGYTFEAGKNRNWWPQVRLLSTKAPLLLASAQVLADQIGILDSL